jgi:hypothetical protein
MITTHVVEWIFPDNGDSDSLQAESPQAALELMTAQRVAALETGREIILFYTAKTLKEAPSEQSPA